MKVLELLDAREILTFSVLMDPASFQMTEEQARPKTLLAMPIRGNESRVRIAVRPTTGRRWGR